MPSGGLGGIFGAGGIPKLRPAGDRKPGGGGKFILFNETNKSTLYLKLSFYERISMKLNVKFPYLVDS